MNLFYNLFSRVMNFTIPEFTLFNKIIEFIDTLVEKGLEIYMYFIPPVGSAMLGLVIAIELAVDIYFFVLWILKKIPMAAIE